MNNRQKPSVQNLAVITGTYQPEYFGGKNRGSASVTPAGRVS